MTYFESNIESDDCLADQPAWKKTNPSRSRKETRKMMRDRSLVDRDRRRDEDYIRNVEKIMGIELLDFQKAFLIKAARAHAKGRPISVQNRDGGKS